MRLHFHISQKDGMTVLGTIDPIVVRHDNQWMTLVTRFGTPADEAYAIAVEYAEQSDIPMLWIDDPQGLYPTPLESSRSA